ncbi:MAG: hypothetical protein ACYSUC_13195 [Planctomycetota bacterium]|jgi:hypothetical protein
MSHAEFTVSDGGTIVEGSHDELAARFIVTQHNAGLDPEGGETPLPVTPFASLVASYLTVLSSTITSANISYVKQQAEAQALRDALNRKWLEGKQRRRLCATP